MNRKLVQIYLSNEEHEELKLLAQKSGMTISDYIRSCTIESNSGIPYYLNLATQKLDNISPETYFSFSTLMAKEWTNIPKNIKSSLGKQFFKKVSSGEIENISICHKTPANVQLYKKDYL